MRDMVLKLEPIIKLGLGVESLGKCNKIKVKFDGKTTVYSSEYLLSALPLILNEYPFESKKDGSVEYSARYRVINSISVCSYGDSYVFKAEYMDVHTMDVKYTLYFAGIYNETSSCIDLFSYGHVSPLYIPNAYYGSEPDVKLASLIDGRFDLKTYQDFIKEYKEDGLSDVDAEKVLKFITDLQEVKDPETKQKLQYVKILDQEQILRYISLLSVEKGLNVGNVKGSIKIKHIPGDEDETLVSVGTINLQDTSRTSVISVPIYASLESVCSGEEHNSYVYLALTDFDRKIHSYKTMLVRVKMSKLIRMLKHEHLLYSDRLKDNERTDVITLTAKEPNFVGLLGCQCKADSEFEDEFVLKKTLFNDHIRGDLKIFGTAQELNGKSLRFLFQDMLGKRVVFAMKRDHIDTLIERLTYLDSYTDKVV